MIFSPLIAAARDQLQEELESHHLLISGRYGEEAARAFREAVDIDLPVVMQSYFSQSSGELERQLLAQEARNRELEEQIAQSQDRDGMILAPRVYPPLAEKERSELERLRAKERARTEKQLRHKRQSNSKPGSKRRR